MLFVFTNVNFLIVPYTNAKDYLRKTNYDKSEWIVLKCSYYIKADLVGQEDGWNDHHNMGIIENVSKQEFERTHE